MVEGVTVDHHQQTNPRGPNIDISKSTNIILNHPLTQLMHASFDDSLHCSVVEPKVENASDYISEDDVAK
jgi:hypothetical protein